MVALNSPRTLLPEQQRYKGTVKNNTLFVFSINGPKQNATSLMTTGSDPAFYAPSHGTLGFALHGSFYNRFLICQNSSTANQSL